MWKHEPYNIPDHVFFVLASLVSLVSYGVLVVSYHSLPESIPVHYNIRGVPDAFAVKNFFSVFGIAVVHLVISWLFLWCYSHPDYANIPGRIQLAKLKQPYRRSIEWLIRHMVMMLFVVVSMVFSYLALSTVIIGLGFAATLNQLPLIILVFFLLAVILVYTVMIHRITQLAAKRKKLPAGW